MPDGGCTTNEAHATSSQDVDALPLPKIIWVPPRSEDAFAYFPRRWKSARRWLWPLIPALFMVNALILVIRWLEIDSPIALELFIYGCIAIVIISYGLAPSARRAAQFEKRAIIRANGRWRDRKLEHRLRARSVSFGKYRASNVILSRLVAAGMDQEPGGCVVFACDTPIPHPHDRTFEPEVAAIGRQLSTEAYAVIALLLGALLLGFSSRILPVSDPSMVVLTAVLIGLAGVWFGVGLFMRWLRRGLIAPRYVRVAPRMIQLLDYGRDAKRPQITSFPITRGTIVYWVNEGLGSVLYITRGTARERISIPARLVDNQFHTRILDALLTTAPTPPLSNEHLVG